MDTLPWRGGGQPTGGILFRSLGVTHVAQIEKLGKIDFFPIIFPLLIAVLTVSVP